MSPSTKLWVKFFLSLLVTLFGLNLLNGATASTDTLWLAVPGGLLMAPGAGFAYYYWAKIRSERKRYDNQTEQDVIWQAKAENGLIKEDDNGKKQAK